MSWKHTFRYNLIKYLELFLLIGVVVTIVVAAISIRTYRSFPLESKEVIMNRRDTGIILLDRNNQPFFTFYQPRLKTYIDIEKIPKQVQLAVIAAEDKNFYHHFGFSARGIARAAYYNFRREKIVSGGSTITQQLVKNSLLSSEKTYERKFKEVILAIKLEQHFSKDDILEMYLNSVYFGEGVFGIEEASQRYFNKSAEELDLAEASMIAGLLPAPSALSPLSEHGTPADSKARQKFVLNQMEEAGFITANQKESALEEHLVYNTNDTYVNRYAPHFALMVRDKLIQEFGEEVVTRSGFQVKTSLDLSWQDYAEKAVREHVETMKPYNATNSAAVIIDPVTREVRALVGSVGWEQEQFGKINMAIAPRQTGSTFKPIVYAAAMETHQITPSTLIPDRPKTYGKDYRPVNYDGRFHGMVTARFALANSLNVPAVDTAYQIGPARIVNLAQRLGISTLRKDAAHNLSTALGAEPVSLYEMTNAYATFANNGVYEEPKIILEIRDKNNQEVKLPQKKPTPVLDARIAFIITSILSDNDIRRQTFGNTLVTNPPAAAKTGTTQDFRDGWTIGYTPQLVVGVWLGNSDNSQMKQLAGAIGAAPLWRNLLEHYSSLQPQITFEQPSGLVAVRVCKSRGLLVGSSSRAGYEEYFLQGTEPTKYCIIPKKEEKPEDSPSPEATTAPEAPPKEKPDKPSKPDPHVVKDNKQPAAQDKT